MPKQIKIIIGVVVGVIGLGLLLFLNQPTEHEQMKGTGSEHNVLQAEQDSYDFGTISMKNGKVRTTFKIKNPTAETLTLTKLYTTCMCTEAKLTINSNSEGPFGMPGHGAIPTFEQRLEPNQEGEIEVIYDPAAHGPSGVGRIERSVIVEGQGDKLATFNVKANVTP
jgi:hypothetical protein